MMGCCTENGMMTSGDFKFARMGVKLKLADVEKVTFSKAEGPGDYCFHEEAYDTTFPAMPAEQQV